MYKRPLTLDELKTFSIDQIKAVSQSVKDLDYETLAISSKKTPLTNDILKLKTKGPKETVKSEQSLKITEKISDIDFSKKLPFLTPAKYVLHCGVIEPGMRHSLATRSFGTTSLGVFIPLCGTGGSSVKTTRY